MSTPPLPLSADEPAINQIRADVTNYFKRHPKPVGVLQYDASRPAMEKLRDLLKALDQSRAEAAALAAWQCVNCGARFSNTVSPKMLEGVTRCSTCVENEVLREQLRWKDALKEVPELRQFVIIEDEQHYVYWANRQRRNEEEADVAWFDRDGWEIKIAVVRWIPEPLPFEEEKKNDV